MCGIAGIVSLTEQPVERPDLVQLILDRLVHRGPDGEGQYVNPTGRVCLGHRRLKIIDLSTGQQPMANEDGTVMVSFNGEIYGFQSLRETLIKQGHRFRTKTDTEVIVHLYEEEGVACLQRLTGMFAFALWDERAQSLFVARDRVGKKPLYYTVHDAQFIFASELPALLVVPGLSRALDVQALDEYFTIGYIPAPRTIFQSIRKLEAGHSLFVHQGEVRKERYWSPRPGPPLDITFAEAKAELLVQLRQAVSERMVSDVPLGCFLSGGVDSSVVVALMAEQSSRPVRTFSIGFPEADISELTYARTVARHFGTEHHEFVLDPGSLAVFDDLVAHLGEPFPDSSALPTWYLSHLTRKSVTVALSGDGGDEVFGGYAWYRTARFLSSARAVLPHWLLRAGATLAHGWWPGQIKRLGRAAAFSALAPAELYAAQRQVMRPEVRRLLYAPELLAFEASAGLRWLTQQYEQCESGDSLTRAMATDLATYIPEDLLVKVDRMSMAHALECRAPFLDTRLVEWALRLPVHYKLDLRSGKVLLREAMKDKFPPGFLDRTKQGFYIPLERWFRGDLRRAIEERVLDGPLRTLGLFSPSGLNRLLREHIDGTSQHQQTLYALLVLATWMDRYRP
jgi:asparagine synthase (glutamine-hydrolysing)